MSEQTEVPFQIQISLNNDQRALLLPSSEHVLSATNFTGLGKKQSGKVRDIYEQTDRLVLVATDRYSAFDRNLLLVPFKGEIVTQISRFWFEKTAHIIGNHVLGYPDPRVTVGKKCKVLPIEVIVRGYITGVTNTSLWKLYEGGQRDFGNFTLPDGLRKNQQLSQLVVTPTTKFEKHDRPLTFTDIVELGLINATTRDIVFETALQLFRFGQKLAETLELILVDTKYEFGITEDGEIILIDEIHTTDSSRYWLLSMYQERFEKGLELENFDKEYHRLWYDVNCDPYRDAILPEPPLNRQTEMVARNIYVYEKFLGKTFIPNLQRPILEQIQANLKDFKI